MTLHSRHGRKPWHDPLRKRAEHFTIENIKLRAEIERLRAAVEAEREACAAKLEKMADDLLEREAQREAPPNYEMRSRSHAWQIGAVAIRRRTDNE